MNRLQGYIRNSRTWWAAALFVVVAMAVLLSQVSDDGLERVSKTRSRIGNNSGTVPRPKSCDTGYAKEGTVLGIA